jgi:hypothetical protein
VLSKDLLRIKTFTMPDGRQVLKTVLKTTLFIRTAPRGQGIFAKRLKVFVGAVSPSTK